MEVSQLIRFPTLTAVAVLALSACSLPNETTTEAAAEMSKPFSTGETLQVLHTLNTGEIRQARLAQQKSENEEVQEAAERIIEDHNRNNQRLQQLADELDAAMEESALSRGLEAQAESIHDELTELSGAEFDCAYLQNQVELHQLAVETVNTDLMPDAERRELRELLGNTAPTLQEHQEETRQAIGEMPDCQVPQG